MRPASYSTAAALTSPTPNQWRTADVYPFPAGTGSLLAAYREALAELDERPAQYTPRAHATSTGAALLLQHSIEATDAKIRAKKRDEEASAAAAAQLRKQQRQHPLYNTHHQRDLLRYWQTHGQPPAIPERALAAFTPYIQEHAADTHGQIKKLADKLERIHTSTLMRQWLGPYAARFLRAKDPTPITARNLRRVLRTATRQYNEQAAHILHVVHKNGQKYVSEMTRNARRYQLEAQQDWLNHTYIVDQSKAKPTKYDYTPLIDCIRTQHHRFSELYTIVRGQEKYYTAHDYTPLFITLTSPASYHPHPAKGANSWDGSSVRDSHQWFTQQWTRTRAALKKTADIRLAGFRVTEPHADGSEHWHLLCYVNRDELDTVKQTINAYFEHSGHAVEFKHDFPKTPQKDKATAAGYMMKYLLKTIGEDAAEETSAANDPEFTAEAAAADAWRSTWNIRAFQFYGDIFGEQTRWRELRRLDTQPEEEAAKQLWRAARGGRADRFIAIIAEENPQRATIREIKTEIEKRPDGETVTIATTGRVIGIEINNKRYITHTTKYRLADDKELNKLDDLQNNDEDCDGYSYSVSTQEAGAPPPADHHEPPTETAPPVRITLVELHKIEIELRAALAAGTLTDTLDNEIAKRIAAATTETRRREATAAYDEIKAAKWEPYGRLPRSI